MNFKVHIISVHNSIHVSAKKLYAYMLALLPQSCPLIKQIDRAPSPVKEQSPHSTVHGKGLGRRESGGKANCF